MFWTALRPLLADNTDALERLDALREGFAAAMAQSLECMWASKIGLASGEGKPASAAANGLVNDLLELMLASSVDYTMLFRRLSSLPELVPQHDPLTAPAQLAVLQPSFYQPSTAALDAQWCEWLQRWRAQLSTADPMATAAAMQRLNPAITWREWLIAPAYEQAAVGDTKQIQALQEVFSRPYDPPSSELACRHDSLRPREFFQAGGISHYSCSS
jgi:uncharacterized protein YdiU (UPF0061 family)